jgi:hypothetical protein
MCRKKMIYILGEMEQDSLREVTMLFRKMKLKIYELFLKLSIEYFQH